MKVYVAGPYCDKPSVQSVQQKFRDLGHSITHDWTTKPIDTSAADHAKCDYTGVSDADIIVLIFSVSQHAYRGTFTEMGIALGLGKKIIAVHLCDGDYKHNPFLQLPQVTIVYSIEALFYQVTRL